MAFALTLLLRSWTWGNPWLTLFFYIHIQYIANPIGQASKTCAVSGQCILCDLTLDHSLWFILLQLHWPPLTILYKGQTGCYIRAFAHAISLTQNTLFPDSCIDSCTSLTLCWNIIFSEMSSLNDLSTTVSNSTLPVTPFSAVTSIHDFYHLAHPIYSVCVIAPFGCVSLLTGL